MKEGLKENSFFLEQCFRKTGGFGDMKFAFCGVQKSEQLMIDFFKKQFALLGTDVSFTSCADITEVVCCDQVYDFYILNTKYRADTEEILTYKIENYKEDISDTAKENVVGFILYLDKQIDIDDLISAFQSIKPYLKNKKDTPYFEFLAENGLKNIKINRIIYFEYSNRKVIVKTDKTLYLIAQKITDVLAMFEDHGFIMPHKSFVINLSKIAQIVGYEILMSDGTVVPLSQKRSKAVREAYKNYCNSVKNRIKK